MNTLFPFRMVVDHDIVAAQPESRFVADLDVLRGRLGIQAVFPQGVCTNTCLDLMSTTTLSSLIRKPGSM